MTPAMAATTVWQRYAGDVRPVELNKMHGKVQQLTPNAIEQKA